jgi:H+/Cl- antiporter ClcA
VVIRCHRLSQSATEIEALKGQPVFAVCLTAGVENIAGFKFWLTLTLLERRQAFASYLVYVLINCSLIVGSVALTVFVAPAAAGSGIAEVKVGGCC